MISWTVWMVCALAAPRHDDAIAMSYRGNHPVAPVVAQTVQWLPRAAWGDSAAEWPVLRGGAALVVAPAEWKKWGISADLEVWFRSESGAPATPVHITEVGLAEYGECGGYSGVYLKVDTEVDGLLYFGKPPASWTAATPTSTLTPERKTAIEADLARRADTLGETIVTTIYAGDIAFSRLTLPSQDNDYAGRDYAVVDVVSDAKTTKLAREFTDTTRGGTPEPTPQWLFDVDGDGKLDVVFRGDGTEVTTTGGKALASDTSVVCY